ncbi:hypothetical protein GJ744_003662 [Endocarpon pusillum]|uniref:Developmental regulator flbA n=1 Tax=Endocarpon pusillum TaxID=364733 RepID=A0A8H7AAE3_9EURO|nr:hypothetical protein GJ744_003662 [Endocarpon pusillum]
MISSSTRTHSKPDHSATSSYSLPYDSASGASSSDSLRGSHYRSPSAHNRGSRRSLAAFARDKTSSAWSNLNTIGNTSTPSLRSATSSSSLSRQSRAFLSLADPPPSLPDDPMPKPESKTSHELRSTPSPTRSPPLHPAKNSVDTSPTSAPAQSHSTTAGGYNKMHQTSSRLLRMTDEERPFTKDFKDLFSTLIVSLPLNAHRVRFTRMEQTFTSEEAINNLGSLKFSQSNRMPDPKDPSRVVTTTTTTTFSMAKEMARSVCQRFLDARFIEPADGKAASLFALKGAVWQLTPKGIHILHRFCSRNGINSDHIKPLLIMDTMQLVEVERDTVTDKLSQDRGTIEVIFRRFVGQDGPNIKSTASISDTDSLSDYRSGILGVKMAAERKFADNVVKNSFTGKAASDWLLDCCSTIDRQETYEIAETFVRNALMFCVLPDKLYQSQNPKVTFHPTKNAIYALTERGQRLCGWITRDDSSSSNDSRRKRKEVRAAPGGNNNRLNMILQDPALRLLFREFLRHSLCEENLSFYLDVKEFTSNYRSLEKSNALTRLDAVRETLAGAYGLYNAFLAPGSPCELNIDHALRNSLASRMTRAVSDEESMLKSLREVVELFENAQVSVFKLMSSDSVPKFVRDPKYYNVLREHEPELGLTGRAFSPDPAPLERSMSRSVT